MIYKNIWWILQIIGCLGVYISLSQVRKLGFCIESYLIYTLISLLLSSWIFPLSYKYSPSFFQNWFIGTTSLAIFGFWGSIFYFKESIKLIHGIGAIISVIGSILLIL